MSGHCLPNVKQEQAAPTFALYFLVLDAHAGITLTVALPSGKAEVAEAVPSGVPRRSAGGSSRGTEAQRSCRVQAEHQLRRGSLWRRTQEAVASLTTPAPTPLSFLEPLESSRLNK